MKSRARGLTLIEVLAATVLLAILVSSCAQLIAQSTMHLQEQRTIPGADDAGGSDHLALARAAEDFLLKLNDHGFRDLSEVLKRATFDIPLSAELTTEGSTVSVRVLRTDNESAEHAWLIFETSGIGVARWIPLPAKPTGVGGRK